MKECCDICHCCAVMRAFLCLPLIPVIPSFPHSGSLTPDAAQLWDRWLKHALLLKESRVLSSERLVELFTPLLLERNAAYSHQVALEAHILLRVHTPWSEYSTIVEKTVVFVDISGLF